MFTEILKKIVDQMDGGIGAVIMGLDGIAVDQYVRVKDKVDVEAIGMEFSFIMTQVRKAADSLQLGKLDEISVKAEGLWVVCRMVTPQYFVAVALANEGNFGKCRYLMRLAAPKLVEVL